MLTLDTGQALTIWTARIAAALYAVALALFVHKRPSYRLVSTLGLATYLIHVALAFEFFYHWSHSTAYRETARQTAQLFGVDWGGGLYLNYLFTVLWIFECAVSWTPSLGQSTAARRARIAVHVFLAFMVLNASVVVWILRFCRAG